MWTSHACEALMHPLSEMTKFTTLINQNRFLCRALMNARKEIIVTHFVFILHTSIELTWVSLYYRLIMYLCLYI
jgi:hypothetical protein